jgi:hypothetical protein
MKIPNIQRFENTKQFLCVDTETSSTSKFAGVKEVFSIQDNV